MALLPQFLSFRQVGIDWYPRCQLVRNVPTSANMAENPAGSWHFARPQLARRYLQTFQIGLVSAQALFAPRRMGKSEFLEQDLIPAAQKSGLLTAYLNLWDAREHPRGALISALARAGSPRGLSALIEKLKTPLKKVKAFAKLSGIAEGSLEAELTEDPRIAGPALSELLRSFDRADRTLLLVLDEAQVLASPFIRIWLIRCALDWIYVSRRSRLSLQAAPRARCDECLVVQLSRFTTGRQLSPSSAWVPSS
jgi:hypothetical protein